MRWFADLLKQRRLAIQATLRVATSLVEAETGLDQQATADAS